MVDNGIHAFRTRKDAINSKIGFIYYAIIPKGASYYIGKYNQIVSSKLIIFKDKYTYDEYMK